METQLQTAVWLQFGAALDSLERAIDACPEHVWYDPELWKDTRERMLEVHRSEFWYWVSHTLFWTDYYLSLQNEDVFMPPAPFGKEEFDERGLVPPRVYTKAELLEYLAFCRVKCRKLIQSMTDKTAFELINITWKKDYSLLEILIYNLRHVQHHTAQLNLILRQRINSAPQWVSRTKHPLFTE